MECSLNTVFRIQIISAIVDCLSKLMLSNVYCFFLFCSFFVLQFWLSVVLFTCLVYCLLACSWFKKILYFRYCICMFLSRHIDCQCRTSRGYDSITVANSASCSSWLFIASKTVFKRWIWEPSFNKILLILRIFFIYLLIRIFYLQSVTIFGTNSSFHLK